MIMTRKGAEFWWNLNREGGDKIIIPPEVAYYSKEWFGDEWKVTTWKDIFAKRKEKQECNLHRKRCVEEVKPCFIWVFYNNSWIQGGWWIYIRTFKKDFGINWNHESNPSLVIKAMTMYPCGVLPMLDNFDIWARSFSQIYHREAFGRKKQGLVSCWCMVNERGILKNLFKNKGDWIIES